MGFYVRHGGKQFFFGYAGFARDFAERVDADAIWHDDGRLFLRLR